LSSAPYQDQNFKYGPEDEIHLLDFLGLLVRKKVLIFFTISIFFVISIFYAFSVTPIYRANISILPPEKSLTSFFPETFYEVLPSVYESELGLLATKKYYIMNKFLSELESYSNQEKVFMEEKFHERFVANNPRIDMKKGIVEEIYRSIHVLRINYESDQTGQGKFIPTVVDYDMKGVNPELASDYLNALVVWVKNKVELDIQKSIQQGVKTQINLLSAQLNSMITSEQYKYEDKVRDLKNNIEIAKNLGIFDNNFDNFKPEDSYFTEQRVQTSITGRIDTRVERVPGKANITWPTWYLYGQSALEHELNLLERRGVSSQYTKETAELILRIEQLSSIDLSKIIYDSVTISSPSITPVDPINIIKMEVVGIGIMMGLFFGILIASLSCLMTYLKERQKLSP
jgi:LPS O-antigen subunit length determinant protein (WzzB/FepE family)